MSAPKMPQNIVQEKRREALAEKQEGEKQELETQSKTKEEYEFEIIESLRAKNSDAPISAPESVPSNWNIQPHGDEIVARNNITARTFIGSIKEFSAKIRGE